MLKLNLGCSDTRIAGFLNVDVVSPADVIADLSQPWPWADSSVAEIIARDVFEHIADKRHSMNEAWRVLAPGGVLTIEVPSASRGDGGFCDPTHVSYWTTSDFEYYEKGNFARERFRNSSYYGVKADYAVIGVDQQRYSTKFGGEVYKITAVLQALK